MKTREVTEQEIVNHLLSGISRVNPTLAPHWSLVIEAVKIAKLFAGLKDSNAIKAVASQVIMGLNAQGYVNIRGGPGWAIGNCMGVCFPHVRKALENAIRAGCFANDDESPIAGSWNEIGLGIEQGEITADSGELHWALREQSLRKSEVPCRSPEILVQLLWPGRTLANQLDDAMSEDREETYMQMLDKLHPAEAEARRWVKMAWEAIKGVDGDDEETTFKLMPRLPVDAEAESVLYRWACRVQREKSLLERCLAIMARMPILVTTQVLEPGWDQEIAETPCQTPGYGGRTTTEQSNFCSICVVQIEKDAAERW